MIQITFQKTPKNLCDIFIGIVLNLYTHLGRIDILTIHYVIYKHGVLLHF